MKQITRYLFALIVVGLLATPPAGAAVQHERYVVSGASGALGREVVGLLLERGVAARDLILVSHRPGELSEFAKLGADVRMGDVTRPETLEPSYAGGTTMVLISLAANMQPRAELQKRMVDAAARAGVKRIVYTSWIGVESNPSRMSQDHRDTEAAIKASGVQWTMLRNGEYADGWILAAARKGIETGRIVQPPDERYSAPIAHLDCAAAVVGAMLSPASANKSYELMGPQRVTQTDIARVTSEVTGRKIEVVQGQPGTERQVLVPPPPGAAPATTASQSSLPVRTPAELAADAAAFKELTGRNPMGLRQIIEAHKAELLK